MAKILITEDEKALGTAMATKLTAEGNEVTFAENGKVALDLLAQQHFDLAIVDLIMPEVDGYAVLERAKSLAQKPPIIIFSNLSQEEDRKRVMDLGAADYFIKSDTSVSDIPNIIKKYIS